MISITLHSEGSGKVGGTGIEWGTSQLLVYAEGIDLLIET
jgi:hypothetical protein